MTDHTQPFSISTAPVYRCDACRTFVEQGEAIYCERHDLVFCKARYEMSDGEMRSCADEHTREHRRGRRA